MGVLKTTALAPGRLRQDRAVGAYSNPRIFAGVMESAGREEAVCRENILVDALFP
jgi:hypothetical protein